MSDFDEMELARRLRAAGHDVYFGKAEGREHSLEWCRWAGCHCVVATHDGTYGEWPVTVCDASGGHLGRASSYDDVLALLAPLLPVTATIPAIHLDAEHERRVEEYIREHRPVAASPAPDILSGSTADAEGVVSGLIGDLPPIVPEVGVWIDREPPALPGVLEADRLRAEVERLRAERRECLVAMGFPTGEGDVLGATKATVANYVHAVRRGREWRDRARDAQPIRLASIPCRVAEVGGYGNRKPGVTLQIGTYDHLLLLTEEEAQRVAGYLYREVALQIVAVTGE